MRAQTEELRRDMEESLANSLESSLEDLQTELDGKLAEIRDLSEKTGSGTTESGGVLSVADVAQKVKPSVVQVNVYVPAYRS